MKSVGRSYLNYATIPTVSSAFAGLVPVSVVRQEDIVTQGLAGDVVAWL